MRSLTKTALKRATVEKDIESAIRAEVTHYAGAAWTSPHGCDGYAEWGGVRLLLETKFDKDFSSKIEICNVLGQCLAYVKKFQASGCTPNVLMIADRNELMVIPTDTLKSFLQLDIGWTFAPSKGHPTLTKALMSGLGILPWVYPLPTKFEKIIQQIETLAAGSEHLVRASKTNLAQLYQHWSQKVFTENKKNTLTTIEQVDVFFRCLFEPDEVYLHPKKRNLLIVPTHTDGVYMNSDNFLTFFSRFEQGYKPSEVREFLGMKDRLLEDDSRRRQGAFFTPQIWADEAHRELERVLGKTWREDCVVWDCAAGTGNLTRDYYDWGCLISTTAESADVEDMRRNLWGGIVGQYDFLNEGAESPFFPEGHINTIPPLIDLALKKRAGRKRLVFFINPPYGTAGNAGTTGTSKRGIAKTAVNGEMKAAKLGSPSQQLYAQFMFRCRKVAEHYGFADYTVALYSMVKFMSSGSFRKFRNWWYGSHEYKGGFLFQASNFADVSGRWGISFTVWDSGGTTSNSADLPTRLTDERDFAVVTDAIKQVYNSDGRQASKWVREPIKGIPKKDLPQFKSGLSLRSDGGVATGHQGHLYYLRSSANNIMESGTQTSMVSGLYAAAHGFSVLPSNWRRAVALYGARKLVKDHWTIHEDEYLTPDTTLPGYAQWVDDCHVYALLDTKNNCTAMRDVQYKGQDWRIKNNWFWFTREQALEALDDTGTIQLYRDCQQEREDSYFAKVLPNLDLSPKAQRVLSLLDELWIESLSLRMDFYESRPITKKEPDLHLHAHDAGVYQLKHLWREFFPEKWKEMVEAHRALALALRDGVYQYGFLK